MYIAVCCRCHYYVGLTLHSVMVVITILDKYCNVLYFLLLYWINIAVYFGGHYYVGCILRCAMVVTTVLYVFYIVSILQCALVVISMLNVYCNVLWWVCIAERFVFHYYVGCIL